jgi:hypothetical protein
MTDNKQAVAKRVLMRPFPNLIVSPSSDDFLKAMGCSDDEWQVSVGPRARGEQPIVIDVSNKPSSNEPRG